eukprot:9475517-Pyramimonas_sp.AAC.1
MIDDWRDCDPWREEWKTNAEWAEPATKLASADDKYTPPSMRTTDSWKAWRETDPGIDSLGIQMARGRADPGIRAA